MERRWKTWMIWGVVMIALVTVLGLNPKFIETVIKLPVNGTTASVQGEISSAPYIPSPTDIREGTKTMQLIAACNTARCQNYKQTEALGRALMAGQINRFHYDLAVIGLAFEDPAVLTLTILLLSGGLAYVIVQAHRKNASVS